MSQLIDPLSIQIQTAGVDTTLPLLPEADYLLQVVESTIDANKDGNGLNWNLKLATTSEVTAVDGRTIKPNHPVYVTSGLQAREDSKDKDAWLRGLSATMDAIFQTDINSRPAFNLALAQSAQGKTVIGHVFIDTYQGRQNNKVKTLKAYVG